jgi:hypothetical protein
MKVSKVVKNIEDLIKHLQSQVDNLKNHDPDEEISLFSTVNDGGYTDSVSISDFSLKVNITADEDDQLLTEVVFNVTEE